MKKHFSMLILVLVFVMIGTAACASQDPQTDGDQASSNEDTASIMPDDTASIMPDDTASITSDDAVSIMPDDALGATIDAISLSSGGITNDVIDDQYGKRGAQIKDGIPTLSLPLTIENAPENTACYALIMLDPDSEPLCGFAWVHWLAVFTQAELPENASISIADSIIQGQNSFGTIGYGGPTPPDKTHIYEITVYALDKFPELEDGFTEDNLRQAIEGHVLAAAQLKAEYTK